MLCDIGAVNRDDQPLEARCRQAIDVARQEPAIGDDREGNARRGSLGNQADDVRMHERLAALQRHVPYPTPMQDRQRPREGACIDVARGTGQRLVSREAAEGAGGVADVGDGKIANGW